MKRFLSEDYERIDVIDSASEKRLARIAGSSIVIEDSRIKLRLKPERKDGFDEVECGKREESIGMPGGDDQINRELHDKEVYNNGYRKGIEDNTQVMVEEFLDDLSMIALLAEIMTGALKEQRTKTEDKNALTNAEKFKEIFGIEHSFPLMYGRFRVDGRDEPVFLESEWWSKEYKEPKK